MILTFWNKFFHTMVLIYLKNRTKYTLKHGYLQVSREQGCPLVCYTFYVHVKVAVWVSFAQKFHLSVKMLCLVSYKMIFFLFFFIILSNHLINRLPTLARVFWRFLNMKFTQIVKHVEDQRIFFQSFFWTFQNCNIVSNLPRILIEKISVYFKIVKITF